MQQDVAMLSETRGFWDACAFAGGRHACHEGIGLGPSVRGEMVEVRPMGEVVFQLLIVRLEKHVGIDEIAPGNVLEGFFGVLGGGFFRLTIAAPPNEGRSSSAPPHEGSITSSARFCSRRKRMG